MLRLPTLALALGLLTAAAGCGGDDNHAKKKSPCEAFCDAAAEANCPNADPDSVCVSSCNALYDATTCQAENRALIMCMPSAEWVCDDSGYPGYFGCDAEYYAFLDCNG